MSESAALIEKYKNMSTNVLKGQQNSVKQSVNEFAAKNIECDKIVQAFYSAKREELATIDKIKQMMSGKKSIIEKENLDKDSLFLFSTAPAKITYDAQLSVLKMASTGLDSAQSINDAALRIKYRDENLHTLSNRFSLYVKTESVNRKYKEAEKILNDVFGIEEYHLVYNLEKHISGFDLYITNMSFFKCQKISEGFSKCGIENYMVANEIKEIVDENKNIDKTNKFIQGAEMKISVRSAVSKNTTRRKFLDVCGYFWR